MSAGRVFYYLIAALIAGIAAGSFVYPYSVWIVLGVFCAFASFVYIKKRRLLLAIVFLFTAFGGALLVYQTIGRVVSRHDQVVASTPFAFEGNVVRSTSSGALQHVEVLTEFGVIRFLTFDVSVVDGAYVRAVCEQFSKTFDLSRAGSFEEVATCETVSSIQQEQGRLNIFSQIRNRLASIFDRALPSPESDVLAGMVIGKQSTFPKYLSDIFQATGTSHIIVLSGFNITILAFVVNGLFRRIGLGLTSGTIASIAVIALFDALVGFSAPVVRASIMVALVLLARARGRPTSSFGILLLSAAVMLTINPMLLRWSLSFELSFAATCGVLLQERISPSFSFVPTFFGLRDSLRTTFAATVMTVPITVFSFGGFSTVALLANAVVLPLVPLIMALGIPLLFFGFLNEQAALIFGALPFVLLRCITVFLEALARIDFSYIKGLHVPAYLIVCWYAVVVILGFRKKDVSPEHTKIQPKHVSFVFVGVVSLVAICILVFVLRYPAVLTPTVHLFDVGQGDALHVRLANGFDFLVDGGPDDTILSRLGRAIPYGDRTIDVVVLTHPHADHVTGLLHVLEKYKVKEFWFTGVAYKSPLYEQLLQSLKENEIQTKVVLAGSEAIFSSDPHVAVRALSPDPSNDFSEINNTSLVLRMTIDDKSILLMGDAGEEVEEKIIISNPEAIPADILKVGHHGSLTASSQVFVGTVNPSLALISVGENNSYELPDQKTIDVFEGLGIPLFRTDMCGTISILFKKGQALSVRSSCSY
jgi:competence protein ComEC